MLYATVSGGSGKERFYYDGKHFSQSKIVDFLNEKQHVYHFQDKGSKDCELIVTPDNVAAASDSKLKACAPGATVKKISKFLGGQNKSTRVIVIQVRNASKKASKKKKPLKPAKKSSKKSSRKNKKPNKKPIARKPRSRVTRRG